MSESSTRSSKKFESAILFQNGSIGDFLMSLFLAELLKESKAVDHITIAVPRNFDLLKGLLGSYPYISAVEVSRRSGWVRLFKIGRRRCLVILQPALGRIPLRVKIVAWFLSRGSGSELIGFQDKGPLCKTLYSQTLVYDTNRLYSENIQKIVRSLGAPVRIRIPRLTFALCLEHIKECGLYRTRYMVFHPGASVHERSFTAQAAREVIMYVLDKDPELRVVLSGSEADREWIEEIKASVQMHERIITAAGFSLHKLAALIGFAEFYLGIDTGTTHLACFLQARVIVVAHCGTATNWLPFYCPSATVLYRLKGEEVVHQTREYLAVGGRGRVKPFDTVPMNAVRSALDECLERVFHGNSSSESNAWASQRCPESSADEPPG
jgi:ADP-heptose:LPS heptosyltransferase